MNKKSESSRKASLLKQGQEKESGEKEKSYNELNRGNVPCVDAHLRKRHVTK